MSTGSVLLSAVLAATVAFGAVHIANLDDACMLCLCEASTSCNISFGCREGYCGAFYLSRVYWADAGKVVLPEDEPERNRAWVDCAYDYHCASNIVRSYMQKFGKDCDGNGVTDCDDYSMIHFNGGYRCETSLKGKNYHNRYLNCRQI